MKNNSLISLEKIVSTYNNYKSGSCSFEELKRTYLANINLNNLERIFFNEGIEEAVKDGCLVGFLFDEDSLIEYFGYHQEDEVFKLLKLVN